jgi:hypothetical protein
VGVGWRVGRVGLACRGSLVGEHRFGFSSNVYTFDADDMASANSTTTLTNATGVLHYEDTLTTPVADQGICYNYLGGANSVVNGLFTVVYNASGIFAITL